MKMNIEGSRGLLDHLDVATLIKTMRSNKIMLDSIVVNDDIEHKILHMDKNIIDMCDYKKNALLEVFKKAFQRSILENMVARLEVYQIDGQPLISNKMRRLTNWLEARKKQMANEKKQEEMLAIQPAQHVRVTQQAALNESISSIDFNQIQ